MVLFWALIVAGIVALVVFVCGDRQNQQSPPSPEQILTARFARGEISETEYRDRLAVLRDPADTDEIRVAPAPSGDRNGPHHLIDVLTAPGPVLPQSGHRTG